MKALLDYSDLWNPVLLPFLYLQGFPPLRSGEWFNQLASWTVYQYKIIKLKLQKAAEFCKETGVDQDGMDYLSAVCIFMNGKTIYEISTLEFLRSLIFIHNDPVSAIKGYSGLRDLFLRVIRENKGEVLSMNPSSLYFENNRIAGVEFQGRDGIGCDYLIWNPQKGGLQCEKGVKNYQLFFLLDEEAIPSSMGDFLVLKLHEDLPFDVFNFLYLSLAERSPIKSKEGANSTQKRGLMVQCTLKSETAENEEKDLIKAIESRLIWLMPFAENRLVLSGSRVNRPEVQLPSYFPKETGRKVAAPQNSFCPMVSLGVSFYYLPHPATDFVINPSLIKRGYDLAISIKAGK